ncbi:MAG: hypothetical protein BRC44_13505 [Cyanobacteria bacterium QS_4_48_99]|nr:MAG: hypothetical protein BRC44_13505 [Cyanobacteria bacterium QS_4_48_99]
MNSEQSAAKRFPKVPIQRRAYAFLIDFATVWVVSSLVGIVTFQLLVFLIGWLGLRVFAVSKYKGQSLGSWAFDMKVIDARFNKIPDLTTLSKREGITGVGAFLAMIGLNYGLPNVLSLLLLISPLVADFVVAVADEQRQQAFHDRIVNTVVVPTKQGFSLDVRIRKTFDQLRDRMRK